MTEGNGDSQMNPFGDEKINFPVTYNFKAMMDATIEDDINKQNIIDAFNKFGIEYLYHDKRLSSKGTYVSFTYKITILNRKLMYDFYNYLKEVRGLKFAL